jgi:hypothetical protein
MTPIDDNTLAHWQRTIDELIADIDSLLADITATSEPNLTTVVKLLDCEHLGGATYE